MLKGFVIGILVMSIFSCISAIAATEEKDYVAIIFGGPFLWLWVIIGNTFFFLKEKMELYFFRKNYACYLDKKFDKRIFIHKKAIKFLDKDRFIYKAICTNANCMPPRDMMIGKNGKLKNNK